MSEPRELGEAAARRSELAFVCLLGIGVPLAYSLVLATQARTGNQGTAAAVLRNTVPAALLGVAAWYVARRIARGRPSRALAGHAAAAGVYGLAWALATYSGFGVWPDERGWASFARYSLSWFVLFGALLYGVIAGAAHAGVAREALRAQREAALRAEGAMALARLEALRARLDPHFLFNALHSLAVLAREDPPVAARGIADLAALLRHVLDAGHQARRDVALDEELSFIGGYLALEQLRLGDRLRVALHVDEEARECGVPAFVLQPIVENAIRHAISPRRDGGTVRISATVDGARLRLEVADDGAGMIGGADETATTGLGLRLVRQLLHLRYGAEATCRIAPNRPHGTVARLEMPAEPPTLAVPA